MAKVKLGEFEVTLNGDLPSVGSQLPDFLLADGDLQNVGLEQFKGKRLVLNIFPSMSTPVCSAAAVKFNALASQFENTVILCISRDLGFSHKQFCLNHNINDVVFLSDMRNEDIANDCPRTYDCHTFWQFFKTKDFFCCHHISARMIY